MELPDEIILQRIEKSCAYCDEKSFEKRTGKIGRKYKLAGNPLKVLKIYPFFILTKDKFTCSGHLTLKIAPKEWVEKEPNYLKNVISYLDITKVEPLSDEEIIEKSKDLQNKFKRVARLRADKLKRLEKMRKKLHYTRKHISPPKKNLINEAIKEIKTPDRILKQLDLV